METLLCPEPLTGEQSQASGEIIGQRFNHTSGVRVHLE